MYNIYDIYSIHSKYNDIDDVNYILYIKYYLCVDVCENIKSHTAPGSYTTHDTEESASSNKDSK